MDQHSENQALISAIIPIAGFPNGCEQILKWTTNPSLSEFEIILVIDSESIDLRNQVESIAHNIRNITKVSVLNSTSRNPGGSRNLGLEQATGTWITFWDCDDVPDPSNFLKLVNQAQTQEADVAIGAFSVNTGQTRKIYGNDSTYTHDILESIAINPGVWRLAFRSKVAKNFTYPDLRMAEDQMYLFDVLTSTKKYFFSNIHVYEYWLYEGGQLTKSKEALKDLRKAIIFFENKFNEKKCDALMMVVIRLNLTSLRRSKTVEKIQSLTSLVKLIFFSIHQFRTVIRTLKIVQDAK